MAKSTTRSAAVLLCCGAWLSCAQLGPPPKALARPGGASTRVYGQACRVSWLSLFPSLTSTINAAVEDASDQIQSQAGDREVLEGGQMEFTQDAWVVFYRYCVRLTSDLGPPPEAR